MQKFEHKLLDVVSGGWWSGKIDHLELADKLNELRREGWEVIACTDINKGCSRSVIINERPLNDN